MANPSEVSKHTTLSPEEFRDKVGTFLLGGRTLKEACKLGDENVEALYSIAHGDYDGGRFDRALQLFRLLCSVDHMQSKHWMGLGASCEMLKDFQGAVDAYAVAGLLAFDDPAPRLHAADCYLSMGDREAAAQGFRYVVQCAGERPEYQEAKQRALARLGMLTASEAEAVT